MEGKREDAVGGDGEKMEIAYSDHRPTLGLVVENVKPPLANDGQIEMDLAPKSVSPAELMDEATETSVKEVEGKNVSQSDRGDDKKITESADVYVGANIEANDGLGLPVDTISSLSVIANYGSDSYDSDDNHNADEPPVNKTVTAPLVPAPPVIQPNSTPPEFPTDYRKIQPSSDDSESDSSASSDNESSSSSSTESFDGLTAKSNGIAAAAAAAAAKMTNKQKVPRTEEEIVMGDLPPIADLHISVAEASCLEMGYITSIVDSQVVIHAKPNVRPLNLETVLFLDKGQRPLGVIFDVFGQVTEPFYSVRFNSAEHVKQKNISVGMVVYCAPNSEHTNYVFVDELMKDRIDRFIDDNKALMKRMYGEFQMSTEYGPPSREPYGDQGGKRTVKRDAGGDQGGKSAPKDTFNPPGVPDPGVEGGESYFSKLRQSRQSFRNNQSSESGRVDACESKVEITTPYWASNSAGKIRAIVNTQHFEQAIHQEVCSSKTQTKRCSGDCGCEQKYKWHRLLAYDPDNDCKGIFMDWFLFPSCCVCRCAPLFNNQ